MHHGSIWLCRYFHLAQANWFFIFEWRCIPYSLGNYDNIWSYPAILKIIKVNFANSCPFISIDGLHSYVNIHFFSNPSQVLLVLILSSWIFASHKVEILQGCGFLFWHWYIISHAMFNGAILCQCWMHAGTAVCQVLADGWHKATAAYQ